MLSADESDRDSHSAALLPVLPEIVLAVGAMVLLMLGAFRGERSASTVSWLAIALLVVAGADRAVAAGRHATTFGGSFIVDDSRASSSCWR